MNENVIFWVGSNALGIILGSFYTVCIERFIRGESIVRPLFSHCPACGKRLKVYELAPIFSYFFLRGRCSSCHTKISLFYPAIECITGCIFVLLAWKFGPSVQFGIYLVFFSMLIIASGIDVKVMLLPDWITLGCALPAFLCAIFILHVPWEQSLAGAVIGFISFWLLRELYRKIRRIEGLGFGDAKLMLFIGALCGVRALPDIVLTASVGALLFSAAIGRKKLSFGPFLSAGTFIWVMSRSC